MTQIKAIADQAVVADGSIAFSSGAAALQMGVATTLARSAVAIDYRGLDYAADRPAARVNKIVVRRKR